MLSVLALCTMPAMAQKAAWNWYFGTNAGLNFSTGVPVPSSDGKLVTNEGCAVISDTATGDLLFYTDGATVWNSAHEVMINGTGLNGDISTSQSAVIVPWIGNPNVYFIFNPAPITSATLNGRCFCLYYSVVDLRRDNGRGEVVLKNLQIATDITEHLAAVLDCRNEGWWILAKNRQGNVFNAFHLTEDRLETTPVVSNVAADRTLVMRDAGQMQVSPDGSKVVVTSATGASQILDFDPITGILSNAISLFPAPNAGAHYGAAFSRNSKNLFVAVATEDSTAGQRIYSFNLDFPVNSLVPASRRLVGEMPLNSSWTPMQLGPDGVVYIGRPGESFLATITDADSTIEQVFTDSAIALQGVCNSGLPYFAGSHLRIVNPQDLACTAPEAGIVRQVGCAEKCIRFADNSVGYIDEWHWTFTGGTPNVSQDKDPSCIVYPAPGTYPVRLVVYNKYGPDTAYSEVMVLENPVITATGAATICSGQTVQLKAEGGVSYSWTPAGTISDVNSATPFVSPKVTTKYIVVGKGSGFCTDTASVTITVVEMRATGSTTICDGGSAQLNVIGGTEFLWSPSTGLSNPNIPNPVATPIVTTEYIVRIRNGDCEVFDTVAVSVMNSVDPKITGVTSGCVGDTVLLTVTANAPSFSWTGNGVLDTAASVTRVVLQSGGTYKVIARNGSCVDSAQHAVTVFPTPDLTMPVEVNICKGENVTLTVISNTDSVLWQPSNGLSKTFGKTVEAAPDVSTTYYATAIGVGGCVVSDSVHIVVSASATIEAGADVNLCVGGSVRLDATSSMPSVRWIPIDGLSDPAALNPVASPSTTTTYYVYAGSGQCEAVDSVTVFVSSLRLTVTADTAICPTVPVQLIAGGAIKYNWQPNNGLSDATIHNPIATPNITTRYMATGTNEFGCTATGYVTVFVKDATVMNVKAGIVHTEVGNNEVIIPLIVDAPQSKFPLVIKRLRATLTHPLDAFLPTGVQRGSFVPTVRDSIRVTYIELSDFTVSSSGQNITGIIGTALLGNTDETKISWESIEWEGASGCLVTTTEDGVLKVTGCNLQARRLQQIDLVEMKIITLEAANSVQLVISGNEPGRYFADIFGTDGRKWFSKTFEKNLSDSSEVVLDLDMSGVSSGAYLVVLQSPFSIHTRPIAWIRQ